jgi:hypothetical protein
MTAKEEGPMGNIREWCGIQSQDGNVGKLKALEDKSRDK